MKPDRISMPGKPVTNNNYLWITIGAAIPIYLAAFFYTEARMNYGEEQAAFLITVFFLLGIFAGRYASIILVGKTNEVKTSTFTWLALTILICIIAVFFMAGATLGMSSHFLSFLFVGVPLLILSVATGMIIKLIRIRVKAQLHHARADAAQSQSELQLLQSQLSPHFLFNTLNNIYGISLTKHEKVPALLLKLSDLLRYSVYDAREQFVPLKHELDHIANYIEFEKIRVGEKLALSVEIEQNLDPGIRIAPLLLIVFIENAFKHAKNTTEQEIMIDLKLRTWGNNILFSIRNSNQRSKGKKSIIDAASGFGLENVRKRLALLYAGEYDLSIQDDENFYTVMLQLKAK